MRKRIRAIALLLLLLSPLMAVAIEVESFRLLAQDMDARINYPERDPSGRLCAIIKVVNPNTGFSFDTGTAAVVKTAQKVGEIWVYVQPGVKKITVSHQTLGVMRDYYLPIAVEEATVYELRLTTGTVHTYVENQGPRSQYLVITSKPEGAEVTIDDVMVGTTPFQMLYKVGERVQYRVSSPLYHDAVGQIEVEAQQTTVDVALRPAHGSLRVTSSPAGARVYVDGESTSRGATPLTIDRLASGSHRVRVQLARYRQQTMTANVTDGTTSALDMTLEPAFAQLTVQSLPGAQIAADGSEVGRGSASWSQDEGVCEVTATLAGHRQAKQTVTVEAGRDQTITLNPVPEYGTLVVESTPIGAEIWLDGNSRGVTPQVLSDVLAMEHEVKLTRRGSADYVTRVNVQRGEEAVVSAQLRTGESVRFSSTMAGARLVVDGEEIGTLPHQLTLSYGNHNYHAIAPDGKRSAVRTVNVVQGITPANLEIRFGGEPRDFTVKGVTFRMMPVEAGTFTMGADKNDNNADSDERPAHKVTLTNDYYIGETEVTQALWQAVMGNNPSYFKGDMHLPVETVSWEDCQEFIKRLNQQTGLQFRLPTEAEWEFAARGGNKSKGYKYSGSSNIDKVAWYVKNSNSKTHPVKTMQSNELGIYDMTCNVWEWCQDLYGNYDASPVINPKGPATGAYRVYRGGSWSERARYCRVSNRDYDSPGLRDNNLGLRLALTL